ncbi:uncharacterized protein LOC120331449 [Styela clava]
MAPNPKRVNIGLLLSMLTIFIAATVELVFCQNVVTNDGLVSEKYEARRMYTITLSIDPSIIQIIADPRFSSEYYPMYEMVYMSKKPRSEIRRISELMNKLTVPEIWQSQTDIVADQTTVANPNKVGILPEGTVEKQPAYVWWVASGFYEAKSAFSSNVGGIFLINLATDKWRPIPIVNRTGKGFSHTEWIDMDIDGYVDCVTIEGSNSMNSLIWLQQPASQSRWIQHRISGLQEDVGGTEFRVMKLPSSETGTVTNVFIVAGRTTGKLTAYWVEDMNNDWSRERKKKSIVIATDGSYVGIEIVDLNMDGRPEILTSTSATAGKRGMVLAYEYPRDGFDKGGKWRKHILSQWQMAATSYTTTSPGPAFSFRIQSAVEGRTQAKPHILVSGQDDGKVYILSPETGSPYIWDYKREVIWSSDKRIGTPAIADVDGNGEVEIFIPSDFSINVMKYMKSSASRKTAPVHIMPVLAAIVNAIFNIITFGRS